MPRREDHHPYATHQRPNASPMRFSSWLLFVLAMALVCAVGAMVVRQGDLTAAELLAQVQEDTAEGVFDEARALSRLENALALATADGDDTLCTSILEVRADIYYELGALAKAREDLETALARFSPGNPRIRTQLVTLELEAGDYDSGLERVYRLITQNGEDPGLWRSAYRLLLAMGERELASAADILSRHLVAEDKTRALELSTDVAHFLPGDPRRRALIHELRGMFAVEAEADAQSLLFILDTASEHFSRAMHAAAQTMALDARADDLAALLELLVAVGREEEAMDIGLLAVKLPDFASHERTNIVLVKTLNDLGRWGPAAQLAQLSLVPERNLEFGEEFYAEGCQSLLHGERWNALLGASNKLLAASTRATNFDWMLYRGMGQANLVEHEMFSWEQAVQTLRRYVASDRDEPFPGAKSMAWQKIIEIAPNLESPGDLVLEATQALLDLEPDDHAEHWLRLAEMQLKTRHAGYLLPLRSWTHGMRLLPERTEELIDRWREIGDNRLSVTEVDLSLRIGELRARGEWVPVGSIDPYQLYLMAQHYSDEGEPYGTVSACKRILRDYPGFLPALDLQIEAHMALDDPGSAADLVVLRFEALGASERNRELLADIGREHMSNAQLLRVMRADPEGAGRVRFLEHLARTGHAEEAVEGLLSLGVERLDVDQRLMLAGLLVDLDRTEELAALVADLDSPLESAGTPELKLRLRVARELGDEAVLDALIQVLAGQAERTGVDTDFALEVARELLTAGRRDSARSILEALDADPDADAASYLPWLTVARATAGDRASAEDANDRLEAFARRGESALGRLLLAADAGDWTRVPVLVKELLDSRYRTTRLQQAALEVLRGGPGRVPADLFDARRSAARYDELWDVAWAADLLLARESVPEVPFLGETGSRSLTAFLTGTSLDPRDPREVLALVLAVDDDLWSVYATERLRSLAEGSEGDARLWPTHLLAQRLVEHGRYEEAERLFEQVTAYFRDFGPGWEGRVRLALETADDPQAPEVLEVKAQRRQFLGELAGTPEALALERSIELLRRGPEFHAQALVQAELAASGESPTPAALLQLARAHAALDQHGPAIRSYGAVLQVARPRVAGEVLPEVLQVLEDLPKEGIEDIDAVRDLLLGLSEQLPSEPLLALALAELDLARDPNNPTLGVTRAYARLDHFRGQHAEVALDTLRPGTTLRWAEFYLDVDPRRALAFVEEELERFPFDTEVWRIRAEVFAALGDLQRGYDELTVVARMLPAAEVLRSQARLAVRLARPHAEVHELLKRAHEIEGTSVRSPRTFMLLARSLLNSGGRGMVDALNYLQALWENRSVVSSELDVSNLARVYGIALMTRGRDADKELAANILMRNVRSDGDYYSKQINLALAGLAKVTTEEAPADEQ